MILLKNTKLFKPVETHMKLVKNSEDFKKKYPNLNIDILTSDELNFLKDVYKTGECSIVDIDKFEYIIKKLI